MDGLDEEDWRAYIASDSDDESDEIEEPSSSGETIGGGEKKKKSRLEMYKDLLNEIKSKEAEEDKQKAHMEVSWHPVDVQPIKELIDEKKKAEEKKAETPWDRYVNRD